MSATGLNTVEMAGVDLIKRRLAELGFPLNNASPEAIAATAMKLHRLRTDKDGFGNSVS